MRKRFINRRNTVLTFGSALLIVGTLLASARGSVANAATNTYRTDITGYQATAAAGHTMTSGGGTLMHAPSLNCPQPASGGDNFEAGIGTHPYGWHFNNFKDAALVDIVEGCNPQGGQSSTMVYAELIPLNLADGVMITMPLSVNNGDRVRANVSRVGNKFTFLARNLTTGVTATQVVTCPDSGGCPTPDIVVGDEASGGLTSQNPANFGQAIWTDLSGADNTGNHGVLYQPAIWTITRLDMYDPNNTVQCTTTSTYNQSGNQFVSTWLRYGCGSIAGAPAFGNSNFTPWMQELRQANPHLKLAA